MMSKHAASRSQQFTKKSLILLLWLVFAVPALASSSPEYHDPFAKTFLSLAIILISAKFFSHFAERLRQPPVLGEIFAGLILGNLNLVGFSGLEYLKTDPSIDLLAQIGVILLLFQVGLESTVREMLEVGISSFLVAALGVVGPFVLGWGVGAWLVPEAGPYAHAFLGATLAATSVGITARVLKDLGRAQSHEARVILGAAVIDDVLGLVILAVVTGVIAAVAQGETFSYSTIAVIVTKASVFLVAALVLGFYLSRRLFHLASKLQTTGVLLAVGLTICFALSWAASDIGLAAIVGAFAAGLILEHLHYRDFMDRGEHDLEELVAPIASFLVPIFFVLMGIRTNLMAFANLGVIWLAIAITVVAILGKQLSCFGAIGKNVDKLSVGIGMIPRGEVGLIFANIGLGLMIGGERVVDQNLFSAVVLMVVVTTLVTPPLLTWSLERARKQRVSAEQAQKES